MSLTVRGRPIRLSLDWLKPPKAGPDGSMSLFEHIAELRYRLIVIALTVLAGTIVCWFFRHQLTDVLFYPYEQAARPSWRRTPAQTSQLVQQPAWRRRSPWPSRCRRSPGCC